VRVWNLVPEPGWTTFTEALVCDEGQPAAFVSVTKRASVPRAPAVKVTWFPVVADVIAPFVIDHAYVLPGCDGIEAVNPAAPGAAVGGAVITGVAGAGFTVTTVNGDVPG
jgi:hypothetical protein